jgi:hypothetical protein
MNNQKRLGYLTRCAPDLSFAGGDFSVDEEPSQALGLVITPAAHITCNCSSFGAKGHVRRQR